MSTNLFVINIGTIRTQGKHTWSVKIEKVVEIGVRNDYSWGLAGGGYTLCKYAKRFSDFKDGGILTVQALYNSQ